MMRPFRGLDDLLMLVVSGQVVSGQELFVGARLALALLPEPSTNHPSPKGVSTYQLPKGQQLFFFHHF
jgi:hypothetical protein